MEPESAPPPTRHLLAVFADRTAAQAARDTLVAHGVPRGAISVDDAHDETPSLRSEMREELDKGWVLPQAAFAAPKEGVRSLVAITLVACVVAVIVAVPLAFIDFGMNFWARLLIVEGVLLAAAIGFGLVVGPALGVKRPNEPMAAQRGVTLRVRMDDEVTRARLTEAGPIRIDEITADDEPVAAVVTEEDRSGGQGAVAEVVKTTADITSNLETDDFRGPHDRGSGRDGPDRAPKSDRPQ